MKLLFSINDLPIYYQHGKSARKISINAILSMQWYKRKAIHDMIVSAMECKLASIPPIGRQNGDKYVIKYGFFEDKSTANSDLDNWGYLIKVVNDCIASKLGINDSYHNIIKYEVGYYGTRDHESMSVQVFKTTDTTAQKLSDRVHAIEELLKTKDINVNLRKELEEILL